MVELEKGKTILGRMPSELEINQWDAESLDWERFKIILQLCFEHYISVDTKPELGKFCKQIVIIASNFEGEVIQTIPHRGKYTLLGELIEKAVKHDSTREIKHNKGSNLVNSKQAFKAITKKLIDIAHTDGHKLTDESAYSYIADLLTKYGVTDINGKPHSSQAIRKWCS